MTAYETVNNLHDVRPYVVHEALIEDHRFDGLRSGEASVAVLKGRALLMIYAAFEGPGDEDRAALVARRSADAGSQWSDRSNFQPAPPDVLNVMSASLLRLHDGRLAAVHLVKRSMTDCRAFIRFSEDEGEAWTESACVMSRVGYHSVNNDRLVQLAGGRLLLPFHHYPARRGEGHCGCVISDDAGRTWRYGAEVRLIPEAVLRPKIIDATNAEAVHAVETGDIHVREPGIVELLDGRILMWARSTGGYVYRAISGDGGETWGPFHAYPELVSPNGPQSVARLPGSKRLLMLLNHRGQVPYGSQQFSWRRPLCVAVSDDDGVTWRLHGLLEPETIPSNCYYSICFYGDSLIFTYYEGVMHTDRLGYFVPRPLASLKLKIVRRAFFEL